MHLRMAYWEYDVNYQMRCEPHKPGGVASNCNMNCIYNWTYSNSTWCGKKRKRQFILGGGRFLI
jgi:hypothetical protein